LLGCHTAARSTFKKRCRRWRSRGSALVREIPFIVYSGFTKLEGARADGELVHKPAAPTMLLATLQGVLAQHRRGIN